MGCLTMALNQICLVVLLCLCMSCNESKGEQKPAVVDWEKNNFGIRTSHSHDDGLNKVNIDINAPEIPKRVKTSRHEPRKKAIKPTITRNKLKIRSTLKSEKEPSELEPTRSPHMKEE